MPMANSILLLPYLYTMSDAVEIKQGDRVGIIGRNRVGKSTLLKILSRITEPTEGRVSIRGRYAGTIRSRKHLEVL
jgi:ABC-type polysaccharide/polyol phosphate transport system ATPase subunit